jgi:hypothetical protein
LLRSLQLPRSFPLSSFFSHGSSVQLFSSTVSCLWLRNSPHQKLESEGEKRHAQQEQPGFEPNPKMLEGVTTTFSVFAESSCGGFLSSAKLQ